MRTRLPAAESAPTAAALLLVALTAAPLAGQTGGRHLDPAGTDGWMVGLGGGLLLDAASTEGREGTLGVGAHLSVSHRVGSTLNVGLQWNAGWVEGAFTTHARHQLTLLLDAPLGEGPVRLRAGPGVGSVTVVRVDGGPFGPGRAGDLDVGIGDEGAWGGLVGLEARFDGPGSADLAAFGDLLYQRAAGFDVVTLLVGGRLVLWP